MELYYKLNITDDIDIHHHGTSIFSIDNPVSIINKNTKITHNNKTNELFYKLNDKDYFYVADHGEGDPLIIQITDRGIYEEIEWYHANITDNSFNYL